MSKVIPLLETIFQNRGGSSKLWKATNEVLLQKSDEAKHFCSYIKAKLRDVNKDTQILALDFLDYSVDDGKMPLWTQISSKDFLSTLINLLKTRDSPEVSVKILFLIEKWGKKFEKYQEIIPNFTDVYKGLKSSGVIFPIDTQSSYSKYIMSDQDLHEYNNNPQNYKEEYQQQSIKNTQFSSLSSSNMTKSIPYSQSINVDLRPSSYEKKYKKLVEKLGQWVNDIEVINANIDNGSRAHATDNIKNAANSLKHGNKQLIETISSEKLKDERLMEISLGIAEDINRVLKRYENHTKGRKADPFLSYFVENNARNSEVMPGKTVKKEPVKSFDIFDCFSDGVNQPIQDSQLKNQQQNRSSTADDLFDLFSNPQAIAPINNNNNNMYRFDIMSQQQNQQQQSIYGMPQQHQGQSYFNNENHIDQLNNVKIQQEDYSNNYGGINQMNYAKPSSNQQEDYSNNYGGINQMNYAKPSNNQMNINIGMGINYNHQNLNPIQNSMDLFNNNQSSNNQYNMQQQSSNLGIDMIPNNNNNFNFQMNNNQSQSNQSNQINQDKLNAIDLLF